MIGDSSDYFQTELLTELEGVEHHEGPKRLESSQVVDALVDTGEWEEDPSPITSGSVSWRPHLWSVDRSYVLQVYLVDELRSYLKKRLQMAISLGYRVIIALRLEGLYQRDVVEFLGEIDAEVIIVDDGPQISFSEPYHILDAISKRGIPVQLDVRTNIALAAWNNRTLGNSFERGRRFERLLAFLLSQVADFEVVERNLRGDTDEIDMVLQLCKTSPRCWHRPGAPFILVEARNRQEAVDQAAVTGFHGKLQTKRQRTDLGLFFSASNFTKDAIAQELKYAQDPRVVVLISGDDVVRWIENDKPDDCLEELVRQAILR